MSHGYKEDKSWDKSSKIFLTGIPWEIVRMHCPWGLLGWDTHSRIGQYTDLVGCVLVPVAVSRGRLTWILAFMSGAPKPASSSLRGLSSQVLTLLGEAMSITWRLKHPFFGIFEAPGCVLTTALRWIYLKRPCATLVRSVGRTSNTDVYSIWLARHTSRLSPVNPILTGYPITLTFTSTNPSLVNSYTLL